MEFYCLANVDSITIRQGVILYHEKLELKPKFSPNVVYRVQRNFDLGENRVDFCLSHEDVKMLIKCGLAKSVGENAATWFSNELKLSQDKVMEERSEIIPEKQTKDYVPEETGTAIPAIKRYDQNRKR